MSPRIHHLLIILLALSMLVLSQLACVCDETNNNLGCVSSNGQPISPTVTPEGRP